MIKIMMGKQEELGHIPDKARQALSKVLDFPSVNKDELKLADMLSVEVCEHLSDEKDRANIHEGFEPKLVMEDIVRDYSKKAISHIMAMPSGQNFGAF